MSRANRRSDGMFVPRAFLCYVPCATYAKSAVTGPISHCGASFGPSRSADDAAFGAFTAPALGGAGGPVAPDHTLSQRLEHLPDMVAGVMSHDPAMQLEATTQFRKLLSIEKNPPIQHVIQAGVVPRFVEFLQVRFPPPAF